MSPVALLRNALRVLVPLAVASTFYLYLYPVFMGCAFPLPQSLDRNESDSGAAFQDTLRQHVSRSSSSSSAAPFRLLALGDPQLEGDTSIPNYYGEPFPHLADVIRHLSFRTSHPSLRKRLQQTFHDLVDFYFDDIPHTVESIRKRIDLFGNDFYLAHIYRTLKWWSKPTHVSVLGDLLGSQWIQDPEFERRSSRFWNRSFKGGERVPDEVAAYPSDEYGLAGLLGVQDSDAAAWQRRIINVAGNHDVGYAGDLTVERLERFERVFGKAAYELRFELPLSNPAANATIFHPEKNPDSVRLAPELRIVNVNDMNLDTPAAEQSLQDKTYGFINDVINTASAVEYKGHFTLVLTHIPLYKPEGICVDAPYFSFHEGGGVREQNQLSADASRGFLEGIFGLNGDPNAPGSGRGRRGVILNGHDHEGCDTYHYINQTLEGDERQWQVTRWPAAQSSRLPTQSGAPGLREITVRAMMGQYGGNAGLLSVWFDEDSWEWNFDFATCPLGRQYFWWAVHVFDLIVVVVMLSLGILKACLAAGLDVDKWPRSYASALPRKDILEKKPNVRNGHIKKG
ncbi:Uu.00g036090.m01.CDS01 [Anthostomella pinea]|uniref:Uu.00g036090.m01.CDS01 n=1 Tax=Anthostomella pinea TaxID=933095 RepID=A0AAI8VAE1_9PEZI|nr:Uu.00g036090.m01.CDS01 [Anthostomella pinea]